MEFPHGVKFRKPVPRVHMKGILKKITMHVGAENVDYKWFKLTQNIEIIKTKTPEQMRKVTAAIEIAENRNKNPSVSFRYDIMQNEPEIIVLAQYKAAAASASATPSTSAAAIAAYVPHYPTSPLSDNASRPHTPVGGAKSTTTSRKSSPIANNAHVSAPSSVHTMYASEFFNNASRGYDILFNIFRYLKVQELLRASSVCRMWNHVANHNKLWETVRMKNSQLKNWGGLMAALRRHGTRHLDLRKILIESSLDWNDFILHINQVPDLETLHLCRCPSEVVTALLETNTNLLSLNALSINGNTFTFPQSCQMSALAELRLKSRSPMRVHNLQALNELRNLHHLSLTRIESLDASSLKPLSSLTALKSLKLGNCDKLSGVFAKSILIKLRHLETLHLYRCPSEVVTALLETNTNLRSLKALSINGNTFTFPQSCQMSALAELRLKSTSPMRVHNLQALNELRNLHHLSLTRIESLDASSLKPLSSLTALKSLKLGDCDKLSGAFAKSILIKLRHLERLRMEGGKGCATFETLDVIEKLPKLIQLELVNFDIMSGFDTRIAQCRRLKRLLIIPTYISQSAATNQLVLSTIAHLGETLQSVTWVVTQELIRATDLYADENHSEGQPRKRNEDKIPINKPVPMMREAHKIKRRYKHTSGDANTQLVQILPLSQVEEIIRSNIPKLKLKIQKVPFSATWRQTINEAS